MISKKGRPMGRRVFKQKIYLTLKQIRWIKSQKLSPSASGLIRDLLNSYMRRIAKHLKTKIQEAESVEEKQALEEELKLLEECLED